jgi:hypothetical protein
MFRTSFTVTLCSVCSPDGRVPLKVKDRSRGCPWELSVMDGIEGSGRDKEAAELSVMDGIEGSGRDKEAVSMVVRE